MKTLLTIFTLVFTVIFSSTSFAGWTKMGVKMDGSTNYIDFERIRKVGGFVYWWQLSDYSKLNKFGDLSAKSYHQGDCKLFRYKVLSASFHKEPMGGGTGEIVTPKGDNANWRYPPPGSGDETDLKSVCSR